MNAAQCAAVYLAAVDLAHAIKSQRDCEPLDEQALLFTLQDLLEAFPDMAVHIECLMNELLGAQA